MSILILQLQVLVFRKSPLLSAAGQRLHALHEKFGKVVWNYQYHLQQDEEAAEAAKRRPMTKEERQEFDSRCAADMINSAARYRPDIAEELKAVLEKVRPFEAEEPEQSERAEQLAETDGQSDGDE